MIAITQEMRENINNALANRKPCILATATADGHPGIGYRGSVMVYDDEHLIYWERVLGRGYENIRQVGHAVVLYRDPEVRGLGWRFYGEAEVHANGPAYNWTWEHAPEQEKEADPDKKGVAVLIRVDRIMGLGDQVVQARD